jgi:hypothetical protein
MHHGSVVLVCIIQLYDDLGVLDIDRRVVSSYKHFDIHTAAFENAFCRAAGSDHMM